MMHKYIIFKFLGWLEICLEDHRTNVWRNLENLSLPFEIQVTETKKAHRIKIRSDFLGKKQSPGIFFLYSTLGQSSKIIVFYCPWFFKSILKMF